MKTLKASFSISVQFCATACGIPVLYCYVEDRMEYSVVILVRKLDF